MDDQNHFPPYVRTAPNRQRPQQQGVAAASSGNITSVPSVAPQEQHHIPPYQPRAQLHTYAVRGSEEAPHSITPAQYQNIDRFSTDKFINDKTKCSYYSAYINRLSTYDDYPDSAHQSPASLAEAGFYYTGRSDCVVCYQCGRSLTAWQSHNDPWDAHARWSTQCDFVKKARGENFITHIKMKYSTTLSSEQVSINQDTQKKAELEAAASPRSPKHDAFTSNDVRLETFRNSSSFIYQTHKDLADAGLFFIGDNDQVKCFHCGGGIQEWEEGDIPLVEHLRWYPSCPYVHKKMDKTIINKLKALFEEENELISQKPSHESPAPSITDFTSSVAYMAVTSFFDDVPNDKIEKAFIYYLDHGNEKPAAAKILSLVLELEDGSESETSQSVMASYEKHMRKISETEALIQRKEDMRKNKLQEVKESIKTAFLLSQCRLAEKEASDRQSQVLVDEAIARELENEHTVASPINNEPPNETPPPMQEQLPAQATVAHDIVTLLNENQALIDALNENQTLRDAQDCSICMEKPINAALLPCGHVKTCMDCSQQIRRCPVCRARIDNRVKVRFAPNKPPKSSPFL